jgi:mono/diheme cytochrome c family protein
MNANLSIASWIRALPFMLAIALVTGLAWMHATDAATTVEQTARGADRNWSKVSVELPTSEARFPAGNGADIANGQCLICHSAGMVLRQPPLTQDQWTGEIEKMRSAYGAPLPADQVEALARYLHGVVGRQ